MQRNEVIEQLKSYFIHTVLDGKDIGLDEATPLLEWGIINSLEIVRLLSFIKTQFQIAIPVDQLIPDNLATIAQVANMVLTNAYVS